MKKYWMTAFLTSIIMLGVITAVVVLMFKNQEKTSEIAQEKEQEELDEAQKKLKIKTEDAIKLSEEGENPNLITFEQKELKNIYSRSYSEKIREKLDRLQKKNNYTFDSPLWVVNPFGTNRTGLYVYLKNKNLSYLKYTITVDDKNISDFTRVLYNQGADGLSKEHEYQIIGLVPGMDNYITLELYNDLDVRIDKNVFQISTKNWETDSAARISVEEGESTSKISSGLYFQLGGKSVPLYDNSGVLRGEIPLIQSGGNQIELVKGDMIYGYGTEAIAKVNSLGQVLDTYSLKGYEVNQDFVYDGFGHLLILATDKKKQSIKDVVLSLDIEKGKVKEVLDLQDIFPELKKQAQKKLKDKKLDWINLNSISMADSDDIMLHSGKLNTTFRVNNVYSKKPTLVFLIGEPTIWEETDYSQLQGEQVEGDGKSPLSSLLKAYEVTYQGDVSLPEGQYYVYFYQNGISEKKSKENSYYYEYLVDEEAKTYQLTRFFEVPYSSSGGTVQAYDDHHIVASKKQGIFVEYDEKEQQIKEFKIDKNTSLQRVMKYTMKKFWFQP